MEDPCSNPNLDPIILEANGCNDTSTNINGPMPDIVISILNVVIAVSSIVALVFMIIGGTKYISSKGEADKVASGKKTVTYSAIGLAICILAAIIVNFSINAINGNVDVSTNNANNGVRDGGYTEPILTKSAPRRLKINGKPGVLAYQPRTTSGTVSCTFSSSNTSIAEVEIIPNTCSANIIPKGEGEVTITMQTSDGREKTHTVSVDRPIEAASVSLFVDNKNINRLVIKEGSTETIKPVIYPSKAENKTITWSSSNTKIVTINNSGKITAKKPGKATITAKTVNGKSAKLTVEVTPKDTPIKVTSQLERGLDYFYQTNYGGESVSCARGFGGDSCGVSAYLASVYILTGKKWDYKTFTQEACGRFYHYQGASGGSNWRGIAINSKLFYENKYGITGKKIANTWDSIVSELKKGHVVINLPCSPSVFANSCHFIVSVSYRENNGGQIYIWHGVAPSMRINNVWYNKADYQKQVINHQIPKDDGNVLPWAAWKK